MRGFLLQLSACACPAAMSHQASTLTCSLCMFALLPFAVLVSSFHVSESKTLTIFSACPSFERIVSE